MSSSYPPVVHAMLPGRWNRFPRVVASRKRLPPCHPDAPRRRGSAAWRASRRVISAAFVQARAQRRGDRCRGSGVGPNEGVTLLGDLGVGCLHETRGSGCLLHPEPCMRHAFALIGVEQAFVGRAPLDSAKLPDEVGHITHSCAKSLPKKWRRLVGSSPARKCSRPPLLRDAAAEGIDRSRLP